MDYEQFIGIWRNWPFGIDLVFMSSSVPELHGC